MSIASPHYTDGNVAILDPVLQDLNYSPVLSLDYLSDSIDREAVEQEFADSDGSQLGSDIREGFEKGSISFQYNLATDARKVRPGHILLLDRGEGSQYYIAGKPGNAYTRNQMVRGSVAVKRAVCPIITSLLSDTAGQFKSLTQAAGALTGTPAAAPTVVNTRSGATVTYSLDAAPGNTVPSWISINSSTGALSGTATAGTYELIIVVTDVLAGQIKRVGFGRLQLVIT